MEGVKYDDGKDPWDLFPWMAATQVVKVLGYGARKYSPDNWKRVPELRRRYYGAALRHLVAWWGGENVDSDSGLPHLAHAICCLMFILEDSEGASHGE